MEIAVQKDLLSEAVKNHFLLSAILFWLVILRIVWVFYIDFRYICHVWVMVLVMVVKFSQDATSKDLCKAFQNKNNWKYAYIEGIGTESALFKGITLRYD